MWIRNLGNKWKNKYPKNKIRNRKIISTYYWYNEKNLTRSWFYEQNVKKLRAKFSNKKE